MTFKYIIIVCFIEVTLCNQAYRSHRDIPGFSSAGSTTDRWRQNIADTTNRTDVNKTDIKLYYETLCPASVRFFTRQLKPVMEKLASHVNVELVPYGHARTLKFRNEYKFRCQHGPAECYGNMLHACAIDAIQNKTQAVLFNICLMQYSPYRSNFGFDHITVLNWCGYKLQVHINGVWECVNTSRGSILLKYYGEQTHALRPQYVPYLLIDGSTEYEDAGLGNLMSTICRMLHPPPSPCYST